MSLFAGAAAVASQSGASAGAALAAGAAAEITVGVASWNELASVRKGIDGHESVNALHDEAHVMDHPDSTRPAKKVRFVDPNETTIRNVKITREEMDGYVRTSSDGANRKRLRGQRDKLPSPEPYP